MDPRDVLCDAARDGIPGALVAIFSASHSSIGRGSRGGTSGAHSEYVTREAACSKVMVQNAPRADPGDVRAFRRWLDRQEARDRKNARIIDKIMLALPRELDAQARAELVRRFAHELTGGQTPWLAAFHDKGKDAHNPHCHFILRDRHHETGRRVVQTTERGSTERIRALWERLANEALEAAGEAARIDRRSLRAQRAEKLAAAGAALGDWRGEEDARAPRPGPAALDRAEALLAEAAALDRKPQGHEGPEMRALVKKGVPSHKIDRIREARRAAPKHDGRSAALDRDAAEIAARVQEARDAHAAAQAEAERAREAEKRAAEAQRAALEARDGLEATQVASEHERAQRAAQRVSEAPEPPEARRAGEEARAPAAERARIEAPIARSRARVLRARGLRNTVAGFLRHVRQGAAMLEPFDQASLGRRTDALLGAAAALRAAWDAFRGGRHGGDFRAPEDALVAASTDLSEAHMVLAPPKRLTGAELAHELRRMARLEAFEDPELIRPALGPARGRVAEIERHIQTPEGAAKVDAHRAEEAERAAASQRAEEARRRAIQRREEQEEATARAERARADMARPLLGRAAADPEAARILDRWVPRWRHFPLDGAALDPDWGSTTDDGTPRLARVRRELRVLDERRRARAAVPPPPEPRPEPGRDGPRQPPASQPDPEPKPRAPDPGSGPRGPGF